MINLAGNRILIADDDPAILQTFSELLEGEGYAVSTARSGEEAVAVLERESIGLVVADLQMPNMGGMELTRRVMRDWSHIPVLILTGHATVESAVEAMHVGALDYLLKPLDPPQLLVRVAKGLKLGALRVENRRLSDQVQRDGRFGEIVGINPKMQEIFRVIERVADTPSRVLIEGEPGTGKELIARAIHNGANEGWSDDGGDPVERPYVAVNCGAFSRNLLESQLFGHKKGTFTGAIADQEGVFVAARAGTLFLDEITELDLDLQVKLLRAIQEEEVTPLGATQPVPIHARIITATNQPIAELVRESRFRADLFYRINVVNIQVPPLRDRVDDVPLLVDYFLGRTAREYRVAPREVNSRVMEAFQSYDWPGNVRELQNVIERAFALGQDESRITEDDLPPDLLRRIESGSAQGQGRDSRFPSFDQVIRSHVVRALQVSRGVKTRAAGLLGIDRNRLYRLMKKYEIPMGGE